MPSTNHDPSADLRALPFSGRMRRGYPWPQPPANSDYDTTGAEPVVPSWALGPGTAHPVRLSCEQLQRWYWRLDHWQLDRTYAFITGRTLTEDGTLGTDHAAYGVSEAGTDDGAGGPQIFVTQRQRVQPAVHAIAKDRNDPAAPAFPGLLTLDLSDVLSEPGGPGGFWYYPYIRWDATALDSPATQTESTVQFWFHDIGDSGEFPQGPAPELSGDFWIDDGTGTNFPLHLYHNPGIRPYDRIRYTTVLHIKPSSFLNPGS